MFKDYFFGYIDGAFENSYIDEYFYNSQNIDLKQSQLLILLGRKGTGKTYIAQKAVRDASKESYNAYIITYNDVKVKMQLLNIDNPNLIHWKVILYLVILEQLIKNKDLKRSIPYVSDNSKNYFMHLFESIKVGVGIFEFILKSKEKESIEEIYQNLENIMNNLKLDKLNLFILDEFDELLFSKEKREHLSTLIEILNKYNTENIKIVILLRDDKVVLSGANQKIIYDRSCSLKWNKNKLYNLVEKRLKVNNINLEDLFPKEISVYNYEKVDSNYIKKIETLNFWDYITDYTFYRPRDIVYFLNICKQLYGDNDCLNRLELKAVIDEYSKGYFYDFLSDELTVYFQNNDIEETKSIMYDLCEALCDPPIDKTKSETRYWKVMEGFKYDYFKKVVQERLSDVCKVDTEILELFRHLLKIGCIGQLKIKSERPGEEGIPRWAFSYQNETVVHSNIGRYILHKAVRYQFLPEAMPGGNMIGN